jgi:parallel beta-helix repeat protein
MKSLFDTLPSLKPVPTLALMLVVLAAAASAKTIHVCSPGTIQSAVNAASSGDIIDVCPGFYDENVTVNTYNLTINGPGAWLLAANPSLPGFTLNASKVTIYGFGCICGSTQSSGIAVNPSGGTGSARAENETITSNTIYLNGTGIFFNLSGGNTASYNNIHTSYGDGIFDYGSVGPETISYNVVYCSGFHGTPCVQGPTSSPPPSPAQSSGIEIRSPSISTSVVLQNNSVWYSAADGIYLNNAPYAKVQANQLYSNGWDGLELSNFSVNNTISNNSIYQNGNDGIEVQSGSTGNTISSNKIPPSYDASNLQFDAQDESSGGTGPGHVNNSWTNNSCSKASPAGLCQ